MSRSHPGFAEEIEVVHAKLAAAKDTQEFRELDPLVQREIESRLEHARGWLRGATNMFHTMRRATLPQELNQ